MAAAGSTKAVSRTAEGRGVAGGGCRGSGTETAGTTLSCVLRISRLLKQFWKSSGHHHCTCGRCNYLRRTHSSRNLRSRII